MKNAWRGTVLAAATVPVGQRQDREHTFILVLIALIWAAIIGGFGPEIAQHGIHTREVMGAAEVPRVS